jgi:hypothetical protein
MGDEMAREDLYEGLLQGEMVEGSLSWPSMCVIRENSTEIRRPKRFGTLIK